MEHIDSIMVTEANNLSSPPVDAVKKHDKPVDFPHALQEIIMFASFPICTFGMIANLLVVWLFCCQLRKTPFILYFLNMAVANLITIFCNFYIVITYFTSLYPRLMFQRIIQMLHISGFDTSFFFITVIAVERYLVLKYPFQYNQYRPKNFSVMISIILWGFSWIVSFVTYYGCFPRFDVSVNTLLNNCRAANMIEFVIELLIFLPSMICSTLAIWIITHTRQQQSPLARLDVTIVGLVLLFLITDVPVRITEIISSWVLSIDRFVLGEISLLLDSINSAGNPLVFIIVGCRKRQKALLFLETALKNEGSTTEKTQVNESHA